MRAASALGALLLAGACLGDPPEPEPGEALAARVAAALDTRRGELDGDVFHRALVSPVAPTEVDALLQRVAFRWDGHSAVFFFGRTPEPHGGGVLDFLLGHAGPGAGPAPLSQAVTFPQNGRRLLLEEIFEGHRAQIHLPEADAPGSRLPRMRFAVPEGPRRTRTVERDAHRMLHALATRDDAVDAPFEGHGGQTLSTRALLDRAARVYLRDPPATWEPSDHGHLHLVELLLAWHGRRQGPPAAEGLERLTRRLLDVDLPRPGLGDEVVAHQIESLGRLVTAPGVALSEADQEHVRGFLQTVESERFLDPGETPIAQLAHVAAGMQRIQAARRAGVLR